MQSASEVSPLRVVRLKLTNLTMPAVLSELLDPDLGPRHAEYRSEMYYCFFALPGLFPRPNIQYILDPGGYTRASSAVILGMRTDISL